MSSFFVNRPIVAIVISILLVLMGVVALIQLPVAQYPDIVPREIQVSATYTGADALTLEQSVATPIEQQMVGVSHMNYMYSVNANNGDMTLTVNFDVDTDSNTDLMLTQMRETQVAAQLPTDVQNSGVTVQETASTPLIMFALYSPNGSYDSTFLANYAYINITDQMKRVPGIARTQVFGAGKYAMRIWVKPDQLAKLGITIPEITAAITAQNTVNPAGKVGGEPVPAGQEYTYAIRAQGRLLSEEEFGNIVLRANANGSLVRIKDVGRIELGAQTYDQIGSFNGKPAAMVALYQLPGSNAMNAADGAKKLMQELKQRFPSDLEYVVALDTTLAVSEGMKEVVKTLFEALTLVILVVFLFLQGWRATLIPLLAVPVSLVGTFVMFPLLGFSLNTLSLFGLVLAIGLVVDDAIVVVEAVEQHIEKGLPPKEATLKAMSEVSGPVIAIALVLVAVFLPTAFIPGITGQLYKQFSITVGVSVVISAFNALTLSPALAALLLRPRQRGNSPVQKFFDAFNRLFGRVTDGYVGFCGTLIRKSLIGMIFLVCAAALAGLLGSRSPSGFLPEEDQGYLFAVIQLPDASSLQRTGDAAREVEDILANTPGVESYSPVVGFNMLSQVTNTYSAFFFITLKDWGERTKPEEQYQAIVGHLNQELAKLRSAIGFAFSPPAIPGIGTSGGVTFLLEDRAGKDIEFLARNVQKFIDAAGKRPELASVSTTFLPIVPQYFIEVDRDKVLRQGVSLSDVYKTLQTFMGSGFVNYFNRFGRQWQLYVQAEGEYRTGTEQLSQFYVLNSDGKMVPLASLIKVKNVVGPEFTMRHNLFRSAQINALPGPGYSSTQAMAAMEQVFAETMSTEMGFDYMGMSYQEKKAQQGVSSTVIFGMSLLCVFLILAAQYESWSLPFGVLLSTPVAVFGAFAGLKAGGFEYNVYAQIALVMLIGLSAKNAILIVEFAKAGMEEGKTATDAALDAAKLRLRPILMTSFAAILGFVPLATASGAGSLARQVTGFVLIGGMLASSFIAICLVPVTFYVAENLIRRSAVTAPKTEENAHE
ncbi:efflux RND transporter permease subunit [Candidatus Methylospira mobilis]|uniref:efflux RND transporter permease subunit n=1 Tax=Candidatus Methylospira mobilis TaxID=1808979 RepID=UPI0028EB5124|nr:efflux RND transporter permease subunit [Candidatus Methylospira mobilis]WNV05504.1 efflux RND transporter permease subunit [Candidatus Methylospira mobilis]